MTFFNSCMHFLTLALRRLPPEMAHDMAITLLRYLPSFFMPSLPRDLIKGLDRTVSGLHFEHPIGLAAGFDKNAYVFDKLGLLGFSFVEVGSITPKPQPGNAKPRLFRLEDIGAIINRYGFNSKGADYASTCLKHYLKSGILGINLGKNKDQNDVCADFLQGARILGHLGDYITINLSSPNTPGLRATQNAEDIEKIVLSVQKSLKEKNIHKPIFIKLAPDMPLEQEKSVIDYLLSSCVAGVILCNTTTQRPSSFSHASYTQQGGLSGKPLKKLSLEMLKRVQKQCQKKLTLISCGGIESGHDVWQRLELGADLVQIYTSFIYRGPQLLHEMLKTLQTYRRK